MKKTTIFSLLAISSLGFIACNSDSTNSASTDTTTTTTNTATTTTVTSNNYAAKADSFRVNSEAGNYLDVRTGKPTKLSIDTATGSVTDPSGKTVRRYVDKRTWWVYDVNSGDTVGSAKMQGSKIMYQGDNGKWMNYDERWKDTDDSMNSGTNMNSGSSMNQSEDLKIKTDDHKMKVDDNEVKVK